MLDDVRAFECYYDSEQENPREDPSRINERLEDLVDGTGIAHERIDTADMSHDDRRNLYEETVAAIREGREYHVGNRIFTPSTFGSLRPVLVLRYEGRNGVDLYPHRNDEIGPRPVGIPEFLDEVDEDRQADHSDYARLVRESSPDETPTGDTDRPEVTPRQTTDPTGGPVVRLLDRLPL